MATGFELTPTLVVPKKPKFKITKPKPSKHSKKASRQRDRKLFGFDELTILEAEFEKNQNWTTELIHELADRFIVTRRKIYKWHYDRMRRHEREHLAALQDIMYDL